MRHAPVRHTADFFLTSRVKVKVGFFYHVFLGGTAFFSFRFFLVFLIALMERELFMGCIALALVLFNGWPLASRLFHRHYSKRASRIAQVLAFKQGETLKGSDLISLTHDRFTPQTLQRLIHSYYLRNVLYGGSLFWQCLRDRRRTLPHSRIPSSFPL